MKRPLILTLTSLLFVSALADGAKAPDTLPAPLADETPMRLPQFPPPAVVGPMATFALAHAEWAGGQCAMYPSEVAVAEYAKFARLRARCWSIVAGAREPWGAVVVPSAGGEWEVIGMSEFNDELVRLLGPEDFAFGRLPPVLPE